MYREGRNLEYENRELYPSENYIVILRYMEANNRKPWEWDWEYPEDMYGRYYPEDITALVQIDFSIHEREKDKKATQK